MQLVWQPGMTLEEAEKQIILYSFRFHGGNKTKTASALGIAIRTLDNKLESYKAAKDDEQNPGSVGSPATPEAYLKQKTSEPSVHGSAGLGVESPAQSAAQHELSMRKRAEVQKVSPQPITNGDHHKRR